MTGDNRKRFCESCQKTVHDLSRLTRREAAKLLRSSRGGLCAKISFDPQGRIVFRPDPETGTIGRLVRLSLLGVSALGSQSISFAQAPTDAKTCTLEVKVSDVTGAQVGGAQVSVAPKRDPQAAQQGKTDASGVFRDKLTAGSYELRVEAPGFQTYLRQDLNLACEAPFDVNVQLQIGGSGLMGDVIMVSARKKSVFRRF